MERKLLNYTLAILLAAGSQSLPAQEGSVSAYDSSVYMPGGGVVWATEDPQLGLPELAVTSPSMVAFDGLNIVEPVRFMVRSNYTAFMQRMEVSIYRADDSDLVQPIAIIPIEVAPVAEGYWDGTLPPDMYFNHGGELVYVLRAYGYQEDYPQAGDKTEIFDETFPRTLQLVRMDQAENLRRQLRDSASRGFGSQLTGTQAQTQSMLREVFNENGLRQQNIPVYGSRVRILGRDIPYGQSLFINGQSYPVDVENKFAAEFLMPIGRHAFDIELQGPKGSSSHPLLVDVTGEYFFGVAIADITLSGNDIDGSDATFAADERYEDGDNFLQEGRLAFYLKRKLRGRYLVTAQMDTTEKDLDKLFDDFGRAYPTDVFRRLDPDFYYPTYGDDSTTYRDVDTQGRFYLRADWDKNQALWGNYTTGLTGTDYAMYVRSLYGGAASFYSRDINPWGDPLSEVRLFGSQAETAPGHNEFLGTGGSLYYLKHTDILPGSDIVYLEIRDLTTGLVQNRVQLVRGADYEIDELQGRIILTRPLAQITRVNMPTLSRDVPLDGFEQRLVVDYEWVPSEFDDDQLTFGVRGKQWFNEHVAFGGTVVDEERAGEDYEMVAGDVTLQAGRGTYLKLEYSSTESSSAPTWFSDNGGFNFLVLDADELVGPGSVAGYGRLVEGRVNLQELGWSALPWTAAAWWRDRDQGFSVDRYSSGLPVTERGGEILGHLLPDLNLYLRYSEAESGTDAFEQAQVTANWSIDDFNILSGELRYVDEDSLRVDGNSGLAAMQYTRRFGSFLEVYGLGQVSLEESRNYEGNDLAGLGSRWRYGDYSSIGAEATSGERGDAWSVDADYRVNADYSIYAGYNYSTDSTERRSTFNPRASDGWTIGQRWRVSNQVQLFNENTWLKEPNRTGLAHTVGLDFFPSRGWNIGLLLQSGELIDIFEGEVDRRSASIQGGRRTPGTEWQSKLEWRRDRGFEEREQWVTTHSLSHKINESWRLAGRLNYSETDDELFPEAGARFIEGNVGFAWRPWNNSDWALFGRVTYLYDLGTLAQLNDSDFDQRSTVFSLEGVHQLGTDWELAGKLARREGEVRVDRDTGPWFDSSANFASAQLRYDLGLCHALAEYRWLEVEDGGTRDGFLIGVDRDISDYFRLGVGYNFTQFDDDLTDFDYDHEGWYLNFVGSY